MHAEEIVGLLKSDIMLTGKNTVKSLMGKMAKFVESRELVAA